MAASMKIYCLLRSENKPLTKSRRGSRGKTKMYRYEAFEPYIRFFTRRRRKNINRDSIIFNILSEESCELCGVKRC